MNIVIAPDSFKGSLSAIEAANAMEKGILKAAGNAEIYKIPMADGGEGTVEALITAVGGCIREEEVTGPLGEKVPAFYGILSDGKTGVIEMAAASGLTLVPPGKRNPMLATSYGTGELIRKAIAGGCTRLVVGIGGSATNDGGMGMAQALGVTFFDLKGNELGFGGQALEYIARIDASGIFEGIRHTEIIVACDVVNPLCGKTGASQVFGAQKGATPGMIEKLDQGLLNYAQRIEESLGKSILDIPGAGAAGGMGGGIIAFLDGILKPGIDIITQTTGLSDRIKAAELIFTGEGRTDFQTAFGKVPVGISRIAEKYGKPVICLSGGLGEDIETLYEQGITALFSIANRPMELEEAIKNAETLLCQAAENIMRLYLSARK